MDYMKTDEFQELYSERYKIEAKNSELKSNFGYDTANACGKNGITIQGASALFLANIKRIIKLKNEKTKNVIVSDGSNACRKHRLQHGACRRNRFSLRRMGRFQRGMLQRRADNSGRQRRHGLGNGFLL